MRTWAQFRRSESEEKGTTSDIDELMVSSVIYDRAARLRSYELLAKLRLNQVDSIEQ